jgi:hypothetical protein
MPVRSEIRNLERRLTGHKTVPADNPPAFVQRPWNSWTYERTDVSTQTDQSVTVTVEDILEQIRSELSIGGGADLRIKVHSSQVWLTAASLIQPNLEVQFFEIANTVPAAGQYPRSTQRDLGTLQKPAKVGYQFPSADKREIMGTAQNTYNILTATSSAVDSSVTSRVQVLWQSSTAA